MGHTISHNLEIILKWTLWSVCAPSAFAHPRRRRRHVHNGATGRATSTAYRPLGPGSPAVASDPPDASISRRRDRPHKRERVHRDAASRWRGACCRARRVRSAHASNATVVVAASAGHLRERAAAVIRPRAAFAAGKQGALRRRCASGVLRCDLRQRGKQGGVSRGGDEGAKPERRGGGGGGNPATQWPRHSGHSVHTRLLSRVSLT